MKKAFSARRVPRKVGQDNDEPSATADTQATEVPESTIKRLVIKPRKSSNLRAAFSASATEDEDDAEPTGVVTPKRSGLVRVAIQRNASKRSSLLASKLPTRQADDDDERPSYSAASLQQLKQSTPSTPRDLATSGPEDEAGVQDMEQSTQALDLTSKFGSSLARYQQPSAIPSAAEIAEKKERRARLAKEQAAEEYISLDPDDPGLDNDEDDDPNVTRDEQGKLILKPKDKYNMAESRLVREDEDIMENFEDFTEDGKISLGRKAEAAAAKKQKQDMAAQIAQAEGNDSDSEDSNASEQERNAAFEAAQTRHGTYGANNTTSEDPYEKLRPKTPPKISPLPTLDGVLERLRKQVSEMQASRMRKLQEMEDLQREKIRLGEEEVRIQKALKETAEKFQLLRKEKGIAGAGIPAVEAPAELGLTPQDDAMDEERAGGSEGGGEAEDENEGSNGAAPPGLGFAGSRVQDGWQGMSAAPGLGMARPPDNEDDW